MAPVITLRDVAERAGVHCSTVSMALRNSERISIRVRRQIQMLASEMGYRMNPLVSALMQSRRTRGREKLPVLAYVTNHQMQNESRSPGYKRTNHFVGAMNRARELGYELERFSLTEFHMPAECFCDILSVRGITGLLIECSPAEPKPSPVIWERFACVELGMNLDGPNLNRVTEDYFSGAGKATEELLLQGYRRIGFYSGAIDSPKASERWLAGYLRQQFLMEEEHRIPPCFLNEGTDQTRLFHAWFVRHRPDALLVPHAEIVIEWLRQINFLLPAHVGMAALVNDHPEKGFAGIYCSEEKLGALGIEMLVGLIHQNKLGVPTDPHEVLLTGKWSRGSALTRSGH